MRLYMEEDQTQCKFPNIGNGSYSSAIATQTQRMDEDDEDEGENRRNNSNNGGAVDPGPTVAGLYGWPSSRIVRVSRATGGKDRHSKVLTSRGLRDRRVRLSVNSAIQFYDLQDRLGYDQPSKAVEWLLAAAANSIAELPPMNYPFPLINERASEKKMATASGADQRMTLQSAMDGDGGVSGPAKSSLRSSSSETSKGSGLSISRSKVRVRARQRVKERALEREKENEEFASFTDLLSGSGINCINTGGGAPVRRDHSRISNENSEESTLYQRFPMDYFSSGLSSPLATVFHTPMAAPLLLSAAADHNPELQPFSSASDHLVSALNTVNSSAINRGTLQSNSLSPSSLHFPPNFFAGAAAPTGNHCQLFPGFDARLHLFCGDADGRQSGSETKDKP